jgi:ABC-type Fe3+ transport system permease subunit
MIFFFSLIPATIAVVVGYFVLFSSARAEGGIKRFGQVLSVWMFLQAGAVVLGGLFAPAMGVQSPFTEMTEHMQRMEQQGDEILHELKDGRP